MRRVDPDVWAGTLITLLAVAAGVPILLLQISGADPTAGPAPLWWLAFVGFLAALTTCTWFVDHLDRRHLVRTFAVQCVLGPTVVLLAPGMGWTPILLVFTAALSVYIVSRRATVVVVAVNAVVAGASAWLGGGDTAEAGLTGVLYLLLQSLSVMAVISQERDVASRRELAQAHTELRATTALLAESSRATERLRIARDLHDVIGHKLTGLALELEVATHHSASPAAEHVGRARQIAKGLLADVRSAVGELREAQPDLRAALEGIAADLPSPQVHLSVDDDVAVDADRLEAIVRCVQEIMTNTIRHAAAANLWIHVGVDADGAAVLSTRDDGRGAHQLSLGNGLTGIRERVEQLGGTARFTSDDGFAVTATVPASVPATVPAR